MTNKYRSTVTGVMLVSGRPGAERVVASGPTAEVFTPENLRKTYGGRLAILEAAGEALRAEGRGG